MINLWLFGTTEGFEFRSFGGKLPFEVPESWMKLSSDLDLDSAGEVFFINKRQLHGRLVAWIGVYRSAFEVGYKRRGGFYGAGVWLVDVTVDMNILHKFLRDVADRIREHAIVNGQFVSKLSNIEQLSLNRDEATSLASTMQVCTSGGLTGELPIKLMLRNWKDTPSSLQWLNEDQKAGNFSEAYFVGTNATLSQSKNWVRVDSEFDLQAHLLQRMQGTILVLKTRIEELSNDLNMRNVEFSDARAREQKNKAEIERLETLNNTLGRAQRLLKDSTYSRIEEIRGGSDILSKPQILREPLPAIFHLLRFFLIVLIPLLLLLGLKNTFFESIFSDGFWFILAFWPLVALMGVLYNVYKEWQWQDALSPFFSIISILICVYALDGQEQHKKAVSPIETKSFVPVDKNSAPLGEIPATTFPQGSTNSNGGLIGDPRSAPIPRDTPGNSVPGQDIGQESEPPTTGGKPATPIPRPGPVGGDAKKPGTRVSPPAPTPLTRQNPAPAGSTSSSPNSPPEGVVPQ